MSNLAQFFGASQSPKSLVNNNSAAGFSFINNTGVVFGSAKTILSGALTANTLGTVLSISGGGGGVISLLLAKVLDATSRTVRLQVTIDGTVAFDFTSSAVAGANWTADVIGNFDGFGIREILVPFNSSLVIKLASSLTETDKLAIVTKYWTK